MVLSDTQAHQPSRSIGFDGPTTMEPGSETEPSLEQRLEEAGVALETALELLDRGRPAAADRLLTGALLAYPDDVDLWLTAGIARLRRGAFRSARAALKMCVWLSGDPVAEQLLEVSSSRS